MYYLVSQASNIIYLAACGSRNTNITKSPPHLGLRAKERVFTVQFLFRAIPHNLFKLAPTRYKEAKRFLITFSAFVIRR